MASQHHSATLEGMPKPFLASLRTLFDILDDNKSGSVRFVDIESRWKDDRETGLPKGVVEALKKVTPPSGLLTFERFVAGLKIALLRHKRETSQKDSPKSSTSSTPTIGGLGPQPDLLSHDPAVRQRTTNSSPQPPQPHAPPAKADFTASLPGHGKGGFAQSMRSTQGPTLAAVRPNNAMENQKFQEFEKNQNPEDMSVLGHEAPLEPIGSLTLPMVARPRAVTPPPVMPSMRNAPVETNRTWQPSQSLRPDPFPTRDTLPRPNFNNSTPENNNLDEYGRNKDDIVFALKKFQMDRTPEAGNR